MSLKTQIAFPTIVLPRRRAAILSRPRLIKLFETRLDHQLVLLVAPPGYGKTSLLVDFAHTTQLPVCWYTIDPYSQEPSRFLAHFTAAIARRFPGFGQASDTFLKNSKGFTGSSETFVQILVNELYELIKQRFVLILDDFHHIDEQPFINDFLSMFLERTSETCCLIISSRRQPRLAALDRLVGYDQVSSLTEWDLAFRGDEIQGLARQNYHIEVSPEDAGELAQRTEGWITGLLLSNPAGWEARTAQLRAVHGHADNLERYWANLLDAQPAPVWDFLLYISLLDDFNAELCAEALSPVYPKEVDWQGLFDAVTRHNLFLQSIDQNGGWLRLHSLLQEYLQTRLKAEKPDVYEVLLRHLVQVYLGRCEWEKAWDCQKRLGGTEELATLIEKAGTPMIHSGRYETIAHWIETLPEQVVATRPGLLSLKGITASIGPEIAHALPLLDQAVSLFDERKEIAMLARSLARRASVRHYLGLYQEALADSHSLLTITRRQADLLDLRAEAFCQCGINQRFLGHPRRAERCLRKALELYTRLGYDFNVACVRHDLGLVLRALGCYKQAEQEYQQSLAYWRSLCNNYRIADVLNDLGVLHHYRGDFASAQAAYAEALKLSRRYKYVRIEGFLLCCFGALYADLDAFTMASAAFCRARSLAERMQHRYLAFYVECAEAALARRQHDPAVARKFLKSAETLAISGRSDSEQAVCLREEGLLALAEGDAQSAVSSFTQATQIYETHGWMFEQALIGVYKAAAVDAMGQNEAAREQLRQSLEIRQRLGEPNCMASEGRLVKSLLTKQRSDALAVRYLAQVEAFEAQLPGLRRKVLQQPAVEGVFSLPKLAIQTLGKTQVLVNGQNIPGAAWKTETARDIFFYLLSHPEGLTKEMAGSIFWPNSPPEAISVSLRNAIYSIRQIISKDAIIYHDERYRFNSCLDYICDKESFLEALANAAQAASDGDREHYYCQAIKMYSGIYLDDSYSSWIVNERERLRQAYIDTVLKLTDMYFDRKDFRAILRLGLDLLEQEPYLEEAHCLLMRAYAGIGNQADLIRQYQRCCQLLRDHYCTAPSSKTQSLYQSLLRS